eukprot:673161-Prymnesium_polylepis.1
MTHPHPGACGCTEGSLNQGRSHAPCSLGRGPKQGQNVYTVHAASWWPVSPVTCTARTQHVRDRRPPTGRLTACPSSPCRP